MMGFPLRTSVGLLLSAVLLAGAVISPGFRHSHLGGDSSHTHDRVSDSHTQHAHAHYHDHQHHHCPHSHQDVGATFARKHGATSVPHIHVTFLLFDLTLPVPPGEHSDQDTDQPGELVYVLRPVTDGFHVGNVDTDYQLQGAPLLNSIYRPAPVAKPPRKHSFPPGGAILLCDTARHERSGVQLF